MKLQNVRESWLLNKKLMPIGVQRNRSSLQRNKSRPSLPCQAFCCRSAGEHPQQSCKAAVQGFNEEGPVAPFEIALRRQLSGEQGVPGDNDPGTLGAPAERDPSTNAMNKSPLMAHKSIAETIASAAGSGSMSKTLGFPSIMAIGIGATIGAGIFVLTGTAASQYAGPAVMVAGCHRPPGRDSRSGSCSAC